MVSNAYCWLKPCTIALKLINFIPFSNYLVDIKIDQHLLK